MNASYYLWKWADNDLPGKPDEVFASLLRGSLHPALQSFDAQRLLDRLAAFAGERCRRGEEWTWQVYPTGDTRSAHFVFLTGSHFLDSKQSDGSLEKTLDGLGMSGYDEQDGHVIHFLRPKLNCLIYGQDRRVRYYDVTEAEIPMLLRQIDRRDANPYAILEDRRCYFVQCCAHERCFCVEWRENDDPLNRDGFGHWRASLPARTTPVIDTTGSDWISDRENTVRFADMVRIFQAFVRGEPKPAGYRWKDIRPSLERLEKDTLHEKGAMT